MMSTSSNDKQSYVTLNVGGQKFSTSKSTLLRGETMLSSMFSERFPLLTEKDEAIFIDRDGTHFRAILNFLRDRKRLLQTSTIMLTLLQQHCNCTYGELPPVSEKSKRKFMV